MIKKALIITFSILAFIAGSSLLPAAIVTFEAESGTLGANFMVSSSGGVTYISNTNDNSGSSPGVAERVVSYTVNFPSAGTYKLYARVRVGPSAANDDSFFYGNGFGVKSPTTAGNWVLVNSIDPGGFTNLSDVVSGSGSLGNNIWKWVNFSDYTGTAGGTPISFTATAGNLSQTFQIGGREDGFDVDKFAFGTADYTFTVANLDAGTDGSPPQPPLAPAGLTATSGDTQVSLSWTASASATSYNVKSATTSGGPYTTITNVAATSFINTGLANGTTYYFVVSAQNVSGESADSSQASATPAVLPPTLCTVNWNDVRQRIDGFGGGVVFLNGETPDLVSDANMNTFFGTNAGQLALTLLRVRIDPNGNWSTSRENAKKAVARGAGVLATPWTPPASMKDNNQLTNGSVLPSQYANYAVFLRNFATHLATNGAPLKAISLQNEPDWPTTYESCLWSGTQFLNFFRTNAGFNFVAPVMMPESLRFAPAYSDPTLNDPMAVTNVSYVGGHLYGVTTIQDYPNAHNKGKPTWMTEYLENNQSIESAITTAKQMHDCLTVGNMSAYIWWKCIGNSNGLVNASGVPQRRGYVFSQWSRFARPNDYRIGTANVGGGFISAYKNTNSGQFAIVAVNTNSSLLINKNFTLTNFNALSVTPWITSSSLSRAAQSPLTVSNGTFGFTLPPMSVVTFVGQALQPNTAPTLTPVSDAAINPGVTLLITNVATDSDLPQQALNFSFADAFPANATLNSSNGVFTWRPSISQADSTNTIQVKVTDDGTPNLSATNNFVVTVNAATQPTLSSIALDDNQMSLTATGMIGPDYTLLTSTNLTDWQTLFTTNPTAMPVVFTDTNLSQTLRFYRLQLGP